MNIDRRTLLSVGITGLVGVPLLSSCGGSEGVPNTEGGISKAKKSTVPKYVESLPIEPDLPPSDGVDPGYFGYPKKLVRTVPKPPGTGGTYKAMTPLWQAIPPDLGSNEYYDAVNKELGLTIDFQVINGLDYNTKIATTLASQNVPDIINVTSWDRPQDFSAAIVPTLFADLTDFLAGDISKKWPNLAAIPTEAWQACVFGGRLYGLPASIDGGVSDGLMYRTDIFEALGVEPPKSADDWLALCKEVNDPENNRWACGNMRVEARRMFGSAGGSNWLRRGGKLINGAEADEFVEALEFCRKLYTGGYVHPDVMANDTADAKEPFKSGQLLMYNDGVGAWHELLEQVRPSDPDFKPGLFPPFSADGTTDPVYFTGGWARMQSHIKKETPKEKIEELLGAMNFIAAPFGSKEYDLITYGPEGVTHEKDENGIPTLNEKGSQQVALTYRFLISPPDVISEPPYEDYVRDNHAWHEAVAPHLQSTLTSDLNVQEPPRFQTLGQQLIDTEADIVRGRKKVSDWKSAVAKWRRDGGDELRAFYEENLEKVGR